MSAAWTRDAKVQSNTSSQPLTLTAPSLFAETEDRRPTRPILSASWWVERAPINAISLCDNAATITAWSNDYDFRTIFSRQVRAHGVAGGILWALSTSGNSPNVIEALKTAQSLSLRTIVMTGEGGGLCRQYADVLLSVPSTVTAEIQQVHICLYHYICERVEAALQ